MTDLIQQLGERLVVLKWMLATAESCTGGMIATHCTDLAGSSRWFDRSYVTYSNTAKQQMLDVPSDVIMAHGAVSEEVARAMACGAQLSSHCQVSLAVTGIAGPGGGSAHKPVGSVWLAWCVDGKTTAQAAHFQGSRHEVRLATTRLALEGLFARLNA